MKKILLSGLFVALFAFAWTAREASACDKCGGKDCPMAMAGDQQCGGDAKGECPCKKGDKALAAQAVAKDMVGKEATCPVTGEKFKIKEDTQFSEYKGQTYYFCCPGCKPQFDKDPEKFLKKGEKKEGK